MSEIIPAVAGTAIGNAGNLLGTILTNKAQKELAKYSYDQQRQMIQEQNAYNSPKEQLARYEEAGLNPNLIYGNGASSAGNQSDLAEYKAPALHAPQLDMQSIGDTIRNYMGLLTLRKDLELKQQEIYNKHEELLMMRANRHAQDIRNRWNSLITGFDPGLVKMVGEDDQINASSAMKRYNAELKSIEELNEMRAASTALTKVQTQVGRLTGKEKQYYIEHIQPHINAIMEKRAAGLDIQNDLLDLQKSFFKADKYMGYGKDVLDSISRLIGVFTRFPGKSVLGPYEGTTSPYEGWSLNY